MKKKKPLTAATARGGEWRISVPIRSQLYQKWEDLTMSKNAKALRQARSVCMFCGGFTTAAAVLAALYHDMIGFVTCVLITTIILFSKEALLHE